jgi:hypothetical protein
MLDQYTFGNSKAAIILVEKINKYEEKTGERVSGKISKIIVSYCTHLKNINDIKNANTRQHLRELLFKDFIQLNKMSKCNIINSDKELITYTKNVIASFHKKNYNK